MPDSDFPSELHDLDPGELIARGLNTVEPTGGAERWVPPTPEELGRMLPQYRVESLLGRGGMGAVYKCWQPSLERPVAIKLLPAEFAVDERYVARFEREARTLARLQHARIVTIHDYGQTSEGNLYFVMEYIDGTDLRRILRGPGLDPEQALAVIGQLCDALQAAHRMGIVHRDIKPENVLITSDGYVKLADFGLAQPPRVDGVENLTGTNVVMGTPSYMAPEQHVSASQADPRSDIFSLGVMFYEMLTGQRPHGVFDPPSQKVLVDVRIDGVVLKALQSEPERRYQSVADLKSDVDRIRSTPPPAEPMLSGAAPSTPLRWQYLTGSVITLLLGLIVFLLVKGGSPGPAATAESKEATPLKVLPAATPASATEAPPLLKPKAPLPTPPIPQVAVLRSSPPTAIPALGATPKPIAAETPADAFQPNSVWRAKTPRTGYTTLTIMERNGETFRALLANVGNAGEIRGTIRGDQVSWSPKEWKRIAGGSGPSMVGTLKGDRLDLVAVTLSGLPFADNLYNVSLKRVFDPAAPPALQDKKTTLFENSRRYEDSWTGAAEFWSHELDLYEGTKLTGWGWGGEQDWRPKAEGIGGAVTSETGPAGRSALVWTDGVVSDFELRCEVKVEAQEGQDPHCSASIYFRGRLESNNRMAGYHVDIPSRVTPPSTVTGISLRTDGTHDTELSRPGEKVVLGGDGARKTGQRNLEVGVLTSNYRENGWNECRLVVRGKLIQFYLNGWLFSELTDESATALPIGLLPLQVNAEVRMSAVFRNVKLTQFPPLASPVATAPSEAISRPLASPTPQPVVAIPAAAASAPGKPADLFQPGSIWRGKSFRGVNFISLTILERNGEMFRALKDDVGNVGEVVGTIKGDSVSWQLRDVKALAGGTGINNTGTLKGEQLDLQAVPFTPGAAPMATTLKRVLDPNTLPSSRNKAGDLLNARRDLDPTWVGAAGFMPDAVDIDGGSMLNGWAGVRPAWTPTAEGILGSITPESVKWGKATLVWIDGAVSDFELSCEVKVVAEDAKANCSASLWFRSHLGATNREFVGYHVDFSSRTAPLHGISLKPADQGDRWLSAIGEKVTVGTDGNRNEIGRLGEAGALTSTFRENDWNQCRLVVHGRRLQLFLNGALVSEVTDQSALGLPLGLLALQLNAEAPMSATFKDLKIRQFLPGKPF